MKINGKERSAIPLNTAVFLCGGCVMALELVGTRLLAPYFGTSIFVWTSMIGVILGCLSIGYWLGGVVADKEPEMRILSRILFVAGMAIAIIAVAGDALLVGIQSLVTDIRLSSALCAFLLFGPPSVLLGMVAPYAVRLKLSRLEDTGKTAGNLYALSTLGSIAGTFLAGFVLLSFFSHQTILFSICILLILISIMLRPKSSPIIKLLVMAALASLSFSKSFVEIVMGPDFVDVDTRYNRVWIFNAYKDEIPLRVLQLNDSVDSAMYLESDELFIDYTRHFALASHFMPQMKRALLIGGGAYTYPMHFLSAYTNAAIDVVEIDPALAEIAKKHFNLRDDPRLRIFHEDGRTFLNRAAGKQYDVVFGDAFKSYSVPFHLATREAMEHIHDVLTDDGIFVINVISSVDGDGGRFLRSLLATIDSAFPQVLQFAVDSRDDARLNQNFVVVAFKNEEPRELVSRDEEMNTYLEHLWPREIPRDLPVMTDDFAPAESYIKDLIVHDPDLHSGILQMKLMEKWAN